MIDLTLVCTSTSILSKLLLFLSFHICQREVANVVFQGTSLTIPIFLLDLRFLDIQSWKEQFKPPLIHCELWILVQIPETLAHLLTRWSRSSGSKLHLGHKSVVLIPLLARKRLDGSLFYKINHVSVLNLAGNLSFQNQSHPLTSVASKLIRS